MRKEIFAYVDTCDICQRMKVPRHKPYGQLQPLPRPQGPWQDISMDFITGLPPASYHGVACDAILVVVDRFSKMVSFIPCRGTVDAVELGQLVLERIVARFGAPKSIVSDRGTTFTSSYWGALCSYLATHRLFSTAFHPQTDGQTERTNQTLECYLRCYINYQQDDWTELLASAEYAINSAKNASTGETPFSQVLTYSPTLRVNIDREPQSDSMENDAAAKRGRTLMEAASAANEARKIAEERMKKAYDKGRTPKQFPVGSKVMLAAKHIRTLRASKKLGDRFLGPFTVLEKYGKNAYRLDLPKKYGRLHHTFHVSLLEAYRKREGQETPEPIDVDGDEEWTVEQILSDRRRRGTQEYYVRWEGFSEAHDTWEPASHLRNAKEKITEYVRGKKKKP